MKKMMKVKEINKKFIGILIIFLFISTTINMSIAKSAASSINAKNTYSISGTVYRHPTDNTVQGVEVLYYDGYGRSFRDFTDSNGRYLIEFNTDPENNDMDYVVAAKNAKYECALLFVKNLTKSYDLWIATPGSGKIYGYTIYLDDSRIGGMEVKLTYCVQPSVYRNMTTISSSNGYYEFTDLYIEPCNNAPMYCYAVNISSQYRYIRIGEYGNFELQCDLKPKTKISNPFIQLIMKLFERFPFFEKILNQIMSINKN